MSLKAIIKERYTIDEYLSREDDSESRSEFVAGRVFGMAGGTDSHIQISFNVTFANRTGIGR